MLKDNYGAPIEGAVFKLYKDGVVQEEEYITDVNGKVTATGLGPGTYRFKQFSTPEGYSMSDSPPQTPEFKVEDNTTDPQQKLYEFQNQALETNGVATLTLLDNNGDPVSGAKYNLTEGTTNSSGQLIFGNPNKLSVGNYSIKQVTTVAGLDPVVNSWPFAILENGDPNQTKYWVLQNEENAGNVTIKLWRKGGKEQWNWECLQTYTDLKPGHTYSFTATADIGLYPDNIWWYQDESDHQNTDSLENVQLHSLEGDQGWDNGTYHFMITPDKDNTTYSFILISGWGTSNIKFMTMDESSRQAAVPVSNGSRTKTAGKLAVSKAQLLGSTGDHVQTEQDDQNNTPTTGNGSVATHGGTRNGTSLRTSQPTVNPSGPPSADYIEDTAFTKTYKITKADNNWKHVFENLDKCDQDENPYYYYVIETECSPDSYHVASYGNDNLTDTGTITITNELATAALPATGGPGTMLIYGLGAVVAEITGYNMLCKRRKKYLNGQRHKIMKKRWS